MNWAPLAAVAAAPFILPRLFRKSGKDVTASHTPSSRPTKVLSFNVVKSSENPFLDESTSLVLYDHDDQHLYKIDNVHDNESFSELCRLMLHFVGSENNGTIYFVTYDTDFKMVTLKSTLHTFLEENNIDHYYIDLKQLFYNTHPLVPKIVYADVLSFYKVPKIDNHAIEYAMLFHHIMNDWQGAGDEPLHKQLELVVDQIF